MPTVAPGELPCTVELLSEILVGASWTLLTITVKDSLYDKARSRLILGREDQRQRRFRFVVERLAGLQLQLIANDLEPRVIDRPCVRVTRIGINDTPRCQSPLRNCFQQPLHC